MLRIRPSIRLRLLHCVRQSVCRDGRVGNKPIQAVLRTALGVRAGFLAVDRFRGRSRTVRRVCLPFLCLSVRPSELCQRFECTGFEQVMGVLSVCAFDGKGVFLPVVDGSFSVTDFGGIPTVNHPPRRCVEHNLPWAMD